MGNKTNWWQGKRAHPSPAGEGREDGERGREGSAHASEERRAASPVARFCSCLLSAGLASPPPSFIRLPGKITGAWKATERGSHSNPCSMREAPLQRHPTNWRNWNRCDPLKPLPQKPCPPPRPPPPPPRFQAGTAGPTRAGAAGPAHAQPGRRRRPAGFSSAYTPPPPPVR